MRKPYVIYGKPWRHWIGGYRALHHLCHELNQQGELAFIAHEETASHLFVPSISEEEIRDLGSFVAVYPERVAGNPYGAPTVARWLLHQPGALGGQCEFGEGEIVFAWSELVRPEGVPLLWVPTVETGLFNTTRVYPRSGTCYYVGKGEGDTLGLGQTGSQDLRVEEVPTREELAGILKRSELFYCYDNYTLLLWEAGMCGCPAAVIPGGDYTREQFEASEYGLDGIAWGPSEDEIARARSTVGRRARLYAQMKMRAQMELVPRFVEMTQRS